MPDPLKQRVLRGLLDGVQQLLYLLLPARALGDRAPLLGLEVVVGLGYVALLGQALRKLKLDAVELGGRPLLQRPARG